MDCLVLWSTIAFTGTVFNCMPCALFSIGTRLSLFYQFRTKSQTRCICYVLFCFEMRIVMMLTIMFKITLVQLNESKSVVGYVFFSKSQQSFRSRLTTDNSQRDKRFPFVFVLLFFFWFFVVIIFIYIIRVCKSHSKSIPNTYLKITWNVLQFPVYYYTYWIYFSLHRCQNSRWFVQKADISFWIEYLVMQIWLASFSRCDSAS